MSRTPLQAIGESPGERRDAVIVLRASGDDARPVIHESRPGGRRGPTIFFGGPRPTARQSGRPQPIYIVAERPLGALVVGPPEGGAGLPLRSAVHLGVGSFHVNFHNDLVATQTNRNDSRAVKVTGNGVGGDFNQDVFDLLFAGLRAPRRAPGFAVVAGDPFRTSGGAGTRMFGSIVGSPHGRFDSAARHTGNPLWTFMYNEVYATGGNRAGGEGTVLRSKTGSHGARVENNIIDNIGSAFNIQAGGDGYSASESVCEGGDARATWRTGRARLEILSVPDAGISEALPQAEGALWGDFTGYRAGVVSKNYFVTNF